MPPSSQIPEFDDSSSGSECEMGDPATVQNFIEKHGLNQYDTVHELPIVMTSEQIQAKQQTALIEAQAAALRAN